MAYTGIVTGSGEDPGDRSVARAVSRRKHDPCPQHVPVFAGGTASAGDQQTPLGVGQNDEMRGRDRHEHGCAAPGAQGGADTRNLGDDEPVPATPPDSTKRSLRSRLITRARERWPDLADLSIRHRGRFAYVDGELRDGTTLPLFRLRYSGSANTWGFAIHLSSRDSYEDSFLPSGYPVGTPEEALDCACGLYLNDPSAWTDPRRTNGRDH